MGSARPRLQNWSLQNWSLTEEARLSVLVRLSGFVVGALLPYTLYFSTKSATLFVGIAAVLALWGVQRAGRHPEIVQAFPRSLSLELGLALILLAYASLSIAWSHSPSTAAFTLGEVMIALAVSLALAAAYRLILPYRFGFGIALGLIAASIYAILEFRLGLLARGTLGLRNHAFVFNRSIVYQVMLLWPMFLLIERRYRWLAIVALIVVAATAGTSQSGAAVFGLVVGVLCAGAAWALGRFAPVLLLLGTVLFCALAPWLGNIIQWFLPASIQSSLEGAHASERIAIWKAFGKFWSENPFFGIGLGNSFHAPAHPAALVVDERLRPVLGHTHPHNAFLQVWVELGLVGAVLVSVLLVLLLSRITELDRHARICATGFAGSALAITAVSHGAWQGWWLTTVSVVATIFWATQREKHHADRG